MIRWVVRLLKYVKSTSRRLKSCVSNPGSVSGPRSGRRSGLPFELGVTALVPPGPCAGLNVRSAENAAGWRPDCPYAPRNRSEVTTLFVRQNGSSLDTHARLTFG